MDHKQNKEFEKLVDHLMSHSVLDEPSEDFNQNVLAKLKIAPEKATFSYKPLISLKTFALVFIGLPLIVFLLFSNNLIEGNSWFSSIGSLNLPQLDMSFIPQIKISDLWIYSLLLFAAFFAIQVGSIKQRHKNSILP